jgi:geranylgeranyl pyrophosphate synthase
LLAGGADIHDDIIDDSPTKYDLATVVGKFGRDLAVLAGDALIFRGLFTLHQACADLSNSQSRLIFELTKRAFFGISSAQADESTLKQQGCIAAENI